MSTSRSKAFAFSALLVLVSGAFVVTAAASTTSALAPFQRGDDYALERPLSRHGIAVGVVVGAAQDGEPVRVEGATVAIERLRPADGGPSSEKTTDDQGRAVFRVPRGVYLITVTHGELNASRPWVLERDVRIALYFDESGVAHWGDTRHRDLERRGETHTLVVGVGERDRSGAVTGVEGAQVRVYRLLANGERSPIEHEKATGPRGGAVFQLHEGAFEVEVEWENQTAAKRLRLHADARAFFVADESGLHSADEARAPSRARG